MKVSISKSLSAVVLLTAITGSLKAATFAPNDGDVFLGIRDTAGINAYVLDIGSMDTLISYSATTGTYQLVAGSSGVNSDLTSLFGTSSWHSFTTGAIGVIGGFGDAADNSSTSFLNGGPGVALVVGSTSSTLLGNLADQSENALSTIAGNISAPIASTEAASGLNAYIVANATGASYASYQLNGPKNSFNLFGTSSYAGIYSQNLETGIGNSLYLNSVYSTKDANTYSGLQNRLLGSLNIDSSGNVNFVVAAVPEPSTYILFGLGSLALVIAYRRKATSSKSVA